MSVNSINIYDNKTISEITDLLLKNYNAFEGYTQVVKLANSLGINVLTAKFEDENIAGMLKFEGEQTNIYIDKTQSANRQRFTIAHELGHYILHRDYVEDKRINVFFRKDFVNYTDTIEQQANAFAASLLMPEKQVKLLWESFKSIDVLSQILRVSYQAMQIRLVRLGVV